MSNKRIIGVISDTHGLFDPGIPALFAGVDHILHAGDIGNLGVYHLLRELAPVTAVSGNVDEGFLPSDFRPEMVLELYGIRILLVHILGHPRRLSREIKERLTRVGPRVVIFGHSHQPFLEECDHILFFNPGSAGPKRLSLPRSVGLLQLEGGDVQGKICQL